MAIKNKRVYFKKMYLGKKYNNNLSSEFDKIYRNFVRRKYNEIPELEFGDKKIYLSAIERRKLPSLDIVKGKGYVAYIYALNIACVNLDEEIKYGNIDKEIDKRESIVEAQGNEKHIGPLLDTQIVVYPNRGVIGTCRGVNRLNSWYIQKFLKEMLSSPAMQLQPILDKKGREDLEKYSVIKEVTYTVASPDKFKGYKDANTSEMADLKFGEYLGGSELTLTLKGPNKENVVSKFKNLFARRKGEQIKKFKIMGINEGVESTIDLIENLLIYEGNIDYEDKITPKNYFDLLFYACVQRQSNLSEFWAL